MRVLPLLTVVVEKGIQDQEHTRNLGSKIHLLAFSISNSTAAFAATLSTVSTQSRSQPALVKMGAIVESNRQSRLPLPVNRRGEAS